MILTVERRSDKRKKTLVYLLFLMPGIIYLIINNYIPMVGAFIAFKKLDFSVGIFESKWVGFSNFLYLFKTKEAWIITRNTLLYNMAFIAIGTLFYVTTAILVFELKNTFSGKLMQSFLLLPYFLSWVIVSYLGFAFLGFDNGIVNNSFLNLLGIEKVSWYSKPGAWPFILTIVQMWKTNGYCAIIYMATISAIDPYILEAVKIDGAGRLKQIRYIILPALKPTIIILTLMAIGRIFYSDFGLFYQIPMDSSRLYSTTQTIDTYVYRSLMAFGSNSFEMSAAAGLYQSTIGFLLVLLTNWAVRKIEPENALF